MASTVLKNAAAGYWNLSLRWWSQVLILVLFITIIQVKSDSAIKSLNPSPSITSQRDQLQTSLPSSVLTQNLYSTSFTEDDQFLSTSILLHQTPELSSVFITGVLSDGVLSEIATTELDDSMLPTSTLSVVSSLLTDELFLIDDQSSLETATVFLSSSNFMVSVVEQQSYSGMPSIILEELETSEIESVSRLTSLEYYSNADTQMSNVVISSPSFYIDDYSSAIMSENDQDLVLQASSPLQFQTSNVLSLEPDGSTALISHELLSTVVRPTTDSYDFSIYTDLENYLTSNSIETTPGLETSPDAITEVLSLMSSDLPYLYITSTISDMSTVSNILDDYLPSGSVEDVQPTTTPEPEASDIIIEMLSIMSSDSPIYLDVTSTIFDISTVSNILDDYLPSGSFEDVQPTTTTTTTELETSDIIVEMVSMFSDPLVYLDVTSTVSDMSTAPNTLDDYLPSGSFEDVQPTTSPELEASDIIIEMFSIMSSDPLINLDVTSTISDMSVSNIVDDTIQISSEWVDASVSYVEDALTFSTESTSSTRLFGQPSPSEFQMSFLSTYSTESLIDEQIVSSQFQTPSLVSIETDVSKMISEYSFIQETTSSVEFNELQTLEPIILCFTTIISLPYSIATIQPSETPDIMTSSSTIQSLSFTEYDYSTEVYTNKNVRSLSTMSEFSTYLIQDSAINFQTSMARKHNSVDGTYSTMQLPDSSSFSSMSEYVLNPSIKMESFLSTPVTNSEVFPNSLDVLHIMKREAVAILATQTQTVHPQSQLISNTLNPSFSSGTFFEPLASIMSTDTVFPSETITDISSLLLSEKHQTLASTIITTDQISKTLYDSENQIVSTVTRSLLNYETTNIFLESSLENLESTNSLDMTEFSVITEELSETSLITLNSYAAPTGFISTTISPTFSETPMMSKNLSEITSMIDVSSMPSEFATSLMTSNIYAMATNSIRTTLSPSLTETPVISSISEIATMIDVSRTASEFSPIQTLLPTSSNIDDTSYYSKTYTSMNLLPSLSTKISNRHLWTVSDAYASTTFSGIDLLTLLPSSPDVPSVAMSSNSISESFGNIYDTPEGWTSSPLLPLSSEIPYLMDDSMVLESSHYYSSSSMESIILSEISLGRISTSSSIPEYLEETYVTCTTIYPDIFETSIYTSTVSHMEASDEIYLTSNVEILTITPELPTFEKSSGAPSVTFVNSATISGTMTSATEIETTASFDSFSSLPLEASTVFTSSFQEMSDSEFIKGTVLTPTFATFVLSSPSIDMQSSSEDPFQSYTSDMLKTVMSSPTPSGFSKLPETSFVTSILPSSSVKSVLPSSSMTSVPSSSPSAIPTTSRSPVNIFTTSVTTKMPYVSLDTSFATQSSWLQVVIEVPASVDTKSIDFLVFIENGLASAYIQARNKELGLRRRRAVTINGITAQQIDISRDESSSESLSVVYYITEGGNRIPASESSITMQHLSTEALSVALGYPVKSQVAVYDQSTSSTSKIWIVAVVCGALAFIFLVCCCFCWCCRPRPKDGNFDPETLKFLQFKQKYPYHSYAASKRRQGTTSPTGAHNSQTQILEDERSVKTSDYHTDEDDSVRIKKKQPVAPPRMPSRTKALVSRQDDVISESDSFVSLTEDELKMSSSVSSHRQLRPTSSKHEQIKEPKIAMFSHVSGQQMSKPKKLQRTMDEAKKQKDAEAEWRKAQAEISAILEPEVVKTQALTTFIAPHKRKKKVKDKKTKKQVVPRLIISR